MSERANSKLKLLYLMRLLDELTDEENTITLPQMIEKLNGYGIRAERKSIYDDLNTLRHFGMDIASKKTRTHNYFLRSRRFELAELKLLVDAVQCSKFITRKKAAALIKKLQGLTSKAQAKKLGRQVYVFSRVKTMNESVCHNVDKIHEAIRSDRQIRFKHHRYAGGNVRCSRQAETHCVSPYLLSWHDENYYLVANNGRNCGLAHFRVDRMAGIALTDTPRRPLMDNFDPARYCERAFGAFTCGNEPVKVVFDNALAGDVIDKFGKDVQMYAVDDGHFAASLNVQASPVFLAWLFRFGDRAKIESPADAAEKMKALAAGVLAQYE